jgi:hypothetical protein
MGCFFDKNLSNSLLYGAGAWGGLNGATVVCLHAWVWAPVGVPTASSANDNSIMFALINGSTAGAEINVDFSTGVLKTHMSARSVGTDARQTVTGASGIASGQWIAVGGKVDFTAKTMQTYYNGAQDSGLASGKVFANNAYTFGAPTGQDAIGGYFSPGPATTSQFGGYIAEVAIYKGDIGDSGFRSLGHGFAPAIVQPAKLFEYVRLLHAGDVNGLRRDSVGVVTGSIPTASVSPRHPRIIRQ